MPGENVQHQRRTQKKAISRRIGAVKAQPNFRYGNGLPGRQERNAPFVGFSQVA
jgi:hypothetical protein